MSRSTFCTVVVMFGVMAVLSSLENAGAAGNTFSGRATVVQATVFGGNTTTVSDTGELPASGGALEASLLEASVPPTLEARVLHASTVGQGDESRAEASVANVDLFVGGNSISADFVMARASATCSMGRVALSGSSEIVTLVVNGQSYVVGTSANQEVPLPNGRIILNEQHVSASGKFGEVTVIAIHVIVDGIADVAISTAHADIACRGSNPCIGDFVTGGGWITNSGAKATFGVAGGIKNGGLWGHLTYIDHGTKMKVKGTGVTSYEVVDDNTRSIEGTCEINGQAGTYQVIVSDNGEPGRDDVFTIFLSNGYSAMGALDGGNIQLHHCK